MTFDYPKAAFWLAALVVCLVVWFVALGLALGLVSR